MAIAMFLYRVLAGAIAAPVSAQQARTIIVMDGSGSMWGQIDGRTKLEIARETAADVLGAVAPEQELGLLAYGTGRVETAATSN